MDRHLIDFLTKLSAHRTDGTATESEETISAFYDFLHGVGVEHCNFGGWQIAADGGAVFNAFNGSRLPAPFLEEYASELAVDDYVMRRAEGLTPASPVGKFDIGLSYLPEMEAHQENAPRVMEEVARYGVRDGFAIIGDTSMVRRRTGQSDGRFFGFCFAGGLGTNRVVKEKLCEIEIATFALIDRVMPQIESAIDGFRHNMTARERDCLAALAAGKQRKQIAFQQNVSLPTVDQRIASIKTKLGAATLPEAVARGYRYGLL